MELLSKFSKTPKTRQILYIFLLLTMFFPLRYVFGTNSAYLTGAYSDFTSFSLYLSDFLILWLFLTNFRQVFARARAHHVILLLFTWILVTFGLNLNHLNSLNLYFLARFIELLILFLAVAKDDQFPFKTLIPWFIGLSAIQSALALAQFLNQRSLGLYKIGESHLGPDIAGVAKIVSHGTKFIRGYGTFPHPNLLSAFLLAAILFSLYKIFISPDKRQKILYSVLLAINIFGLTVTFSRAGIGATILATIIFLVWLAINQGLTKRLVWLAAITGIAFVAAFAIFHQFLFTRATLTDDAVKERVFYNRVGLRMIKSKPIQGIGFGTSVLHMQQFSPIKLEPWEIQPIHNYYLLAAAEIGIIGAGLFIILFLWHLVKLFQNIIKSRQQGEGDYVYQLTLGCIFFGFLVLMLLDHYFYTIGQTQLLLWSILGLISAEIIRDKNYL